MSPRDNNARSAGLRHILDVVASIVMTIAAIVLIWRNFLNPWLTQRKDAAIPSDPISLSSSTPVLGMTTAKVVMIEYSDFQCPFCGQFSRGRLKEIRRKYIDTGQVRLAFRNLPLRELHPLAEEAARAAACAQSAGVFWKYHDSLFADQTRLAHEDLLSRATNMGLPKTGFLACLESDGAKEVERSLEEAGTLSIRSTPTVLLGLSQPDGRVRIVKLLLATNDRELTSALDRLLASGNGQARSEIR